MAEKLSEKIYNSIKKDIEDGRLDTREFFSEAQFAEKYNVSKAPVRDALHLLCSEGYMVSYHRKGYMVNSFSVDEINQIQTIRRAILEKPQWHGELSYSERSRANRNMNQIGG